MVNKLQLIAGNANLELAEKISEHLSVPLEQVELSSFSDGETRVEIKANVRGNDVFILQPTSPNVNQNLMEALIEFVAYWNAYSNKVAQEIWSILSSKSNNFPKRKKKLPKIIINLLRPPT